MGGGGQQSIMEGMARDAFATFDNSKFKPIGSRQGWGRKRSLAISPQPGTSSTVTALAV